MSLLLNEDYTLYSLRLGYLRNIDDGVGERLITINANILQDHAFRAAGFVIDAAAIKRCYSPPIPTTGGAEYFTRPVRSAQGRSLHDESFDEEEEESRGLLTGRTSEDTLGPAALNERERRRRKQREHLQEDDSSDLSDDSDDEEPSAAASVRFSKVATQGSSSVASRSAKAAPEVKIISPSYRPRTSSLGASEAMRSSGRPARPRADTVTSSEFSSESEMLDINPVFRRKLPTRSGRPTVLANKIAEEIEDSDLEDVDDDVEDEEDAEVAEASDLSDEFEGEDIAIASPDVLGDVASGLSPGYASQASSDEPPPQSALPPAEDILVDLAGLPDGKYPTLSESSLLTQALRGDAPSSCDSKSFQKYAELSGKNELSPIWIKIYYPSVGEPSTVLQVPIKRQAASGDIPGPPTVNDLIGLSLYRYQEEECQPALQGQDNSIERWELRMVDDGEIEMDFPALSSTRAITDFTSNNNRPPARRARDKPWDEFGLVRLKGDIEPELTEEPAVIPPVLQQRQSVAFSTTQATASALTPSMIPGRNPIMGPSFALSKATRKDSNNLLDVPAAPMATFTPRSGPETEIIIHFTDPQSFQSTQLPINVPADTYIAEVFDTACTRLRLDKALYVLKVRGTQTVAPPDRTVEALGANLHLDLARRRFGAVGDFGLGTSGSPGSTSPNAPLQLVPNTPPTGKDGKRRKPLASASSKKYELVTTTTLNSMNEQAGRRYNVLRKQPLSFSASHPRTLIITPEFLQILPAQDGQDGPVSGKVTNIHMSSIIGVKVSRKHPKVVRVVVFREKEAKRYDFECSSREEAQAVVADVRVGVGEYGRPEDSVEK